MSYFFSPIIAQCGSQEKEFITWQGEGEKDTNLSKAGSLAVSINTLQSRSQATFIQGLQEAPMPNQNPAANPSESTSHSIKI